MPERKVHLVTYGTPRFAHRQFLLGLSAKVNNVVDTVTAWSPKALMQTGFPKMANDIQLTERGSGFYSWKPFIIHRRLCEVPDGDVVFYCDVGRKYPFILLENNTLPFQAWMDNNSQDAVPGVEIPWFGPVSAWTKRGVLSALGMDNELICSKPVIQASFSFWRATEETRQFTSNWTRLCADRQMVSDDPIDIGLPDHDDFVEHKHDQSLLTLCCYQADLKAIYVGEAPPPINDKSPDQVASYCWATGNQKPNIYSKLVKQAAKIIGSTECAARRIVKFN